MLILLVIGAVVSLMMVLESVDVRVRDEAA